jgi:hypothetical protein
VLTTKKYNHSIVTSFPRDCKFSIFQLHTSPFIPDFCIFAMTLTAQQGDNTPRRLEANEFNVDDKPVSPAVKDPFGDERDATVKYKTMTWW